MKKITAYIILVTLLLYAVRAIEYAGIRKLESGEFAKLNTAFLQKNHFEILIIGSSRAECQYYPPLIDSATGLKSFNLGMTGATMPLIRSSLEAYLENSNAPKTVILNLDLHAFKDNPDSIFHYPRYFPFLANKKLYEGLCEHDERFPYFRYIPYYSMPHFGTRYLNAAIRGWTGKTGYYDTMYVNGFSPSETNPLMPKPDSYQTHEYTSIPQPYVFKNLDRIISICKIHNISVCMVVSPIYYEWEEKITNYNELIDTFQQYALQHDADFIDLSNDSLRFSKVYYTDPAHYNRTGAIIFTRRFLKEFRQ
ncbi:MAG: hypothetical protein Fur0041_23350 [Bacteroidia bacterium]